ncbi:bifunctional lysylphosphatidylglycerol flippase/synthetase MprF [Mycobacterium sp. Aquia_213]|uniref:bifunctional lysylphosphatidylglycerol flippase/synthetase MprF n=1 Tax=Mycobacterium sp. Aquia_213 TaxID=2991728 RepID=UPI00226DEF91|nr:phosphatidylglycerol lysyltransferase domain-containing protein [Mycobacterium sp. Aquia_213]WAC93813.1 phosphatidylglycerol lysyltransferase domain-containing protein [Mycobacterium sp. Aquia_213]
MKISQGSGEATTERGRERVLVRVDIPAIRLISTLVLMCVLGWLAVLIVRDFLGYERVAPGRFGWSVALLAALALISRGIVLGRPVTTGHALTAAAAVCAGVGAHFLSYGLFGNILAASSGLVLMWPTKAQPQPEMLERIWALVNVTRADPLAPFAMHSTKSYHFNSDKTAAIAYRTRLGFAVVSGDPIGDAAQFPAVVADFVRMCRGRGWQIIVLACGQRYLGLWSDETVGQPMLAVPIGRDVVVDVRHFTLQGRRFRNLRQAVQRSHNCGITTEIVDEQELDSALIAELTEVLHAAHRAARTERGFCMSLDGVLTGRYPGVKLAIARDRCGCVVAFHRYATAERGSEVSLDVPFRRPGAANGVDERLSVDMIADAKSHDALRVSLAFAAFPEIFDTDRRGALQRVAYRLTHLLDPLIRLESLYRYLRKFHSLAERRYVVLCAHHIPGALIVLLSLEFMPRPRHLRSAHRGAT